MVELEISHIKTTREYFNELEYGVSACLLARSWIAINNLGRATISIQSYLNHKLHFLADMGDILFLGGVKSEKKGRLDF